MPMPAQATTIPKTYSSSAFRARNVRPAKTRRRMIVLRAGAMPASAVAERVITWATFAMVATVSHET